MGQERGVSCLPLLDLEQSDNLLLRFCHLAMAREANQLRISCPLEVQCAALRPMQLAEVQHS